MYFRVVPQHLAVSPRSGLYIETPLRYIFRQISRSSRVSSTTIPRYRVCTLWNEPFTPMVNQNTAVICAVDPSSGSVLRSIENSTHLFFSSRGWVKAKVELPYIHVSHIYVV